MCELFALSASAPVDIKLSLAELARHGGATGIHADGWGVAFGDGRDARVFREPAAAARSPGVQCLQAHPVSSDTVIAHIRHATQGKITLANTQPFVRELGGRIHVFAHNGNLGGHPGRTREDGTSHRQRFTPVGETDSETAFCDLMNRLAEKVGYRDDPGTTLGLFADFARDMRDRGPANLIWASDRRLLVHADRRTQSPGVVAPPGLWMLQRQCGSAPETRFEGGGVNVGGSAMNVVLVASVPLTDEDWRPLGRGSVLAMERGRVGETVLI